jgi:hypothetical protein
MSYASQKGAIGDYSVMEFLNGIFTQFGFTFKRVGGAERTRKVFAGDVCLVPSQSERDVKFCVLEPYFIESKRKENPRIFVDAAKARADAKWHGKRGYILFASKQARGSKVGEDEIVVMDRSTLEAILVELQGFKNEELEHAKN